MSAHLACRLRLIPLYSWYHTGFDTEPSLIHPLYQKYREILPFEKLWMDFHQCLWPSDVVSQSDFADVDLAKDSTALASLFAAINDAFLPASPLDRERWGQDVVISFSHFVPRIELIPEQRFLLEPALVRVSGSLHLGRQVTQLRPDVHMVRLHAACLFSSQPYCTH